MLGAIGQHSYGTCTRSKYYHFKSSNAASPAFEIMLIIRAVGSGTASTTMAVLVFEQFLTTHVQMGIVEGMVN